MAIQASLAKRKEIADHTLEGAKLAIDVGKQREQNQHLKDVAKMQTEAQKELATKQTETKPKEKAK